MITVTAWISTKILFKSCCSTHPKVFCVLKGTLNEIPTGFNLTSRRSLVVRLSGAIQCEQFPVRGGDLFLPRGFRQLGCDFGGTNRFGETPRLGICSGQRTHEKS